MASYGNVAKTAVSVTSVAVLLSLKSTVVKDFLRQILRRLLPRWFRLIISEQLNVSTSTKRWPPSPAAVVRYGSPLLVILAVSAVWLVKKSHVESQMDDDEKHWLQEEINRRRDHLRSVMRFAVKKLEKKDPEIDINSVIRASEDVACCNRFDKMASEGYLLAAKGVALRLSDMLNKWNDDPEVASQQATALSEEIYVSKTIVAHIDRFLLNRRKVLSCMQNELDMAKRRLKLRRSSQLTKAIGLLERSSSQLPYMAISGSFSIVHGIVEALRVNSMARIFSAAMTPPETISEQPAPKSHTISALLVVELLGIMLAFVKDKVNEMGQARYIRELKVDVFKALVSQDMEFIEKHDMTEYSSLILKVDNVCTCLWNLPITTIDMVARIVSSSLLLWSQSYKLSVMMGVILPLRLAVNYLLQYIRDYIEASVIMVDVRGSFGNIMGSLMNKVAFQTLRSFGREPVETTVYAQKLKAHERYMERGRLLYNVFSPIDSLVDKLVEVAGYWYGSKLASSDEMDAADLPSFLDVSYTTFDRVQYLYAHLMSISEDILDPAERMYNLLHTKPRIGLDSPPYENMPSPDSVEWNIRFDNVDFSYPTRPAAKILKGINFFIAEGQQVGIMGESGCGKSTLFSLILRLYDVQNGSILIGDKKLTAYNPLWIRQNVAIVSQSTYFPFRTVKENLLYGCEHMDSPPTIEELHDAMRLARCEELFFDTNRFPQQWHTDIGRNAEKLSGGERQRLSIARSALRKPRILLLDEATSALDEELQYQVQEAVQELHRRSGRKLTIITIAHRLSNFRHVDSMLVLENGTVVEEGTPSYLAKNSSENSVFRKFFKRHAEALQDVS